MAIKWTTKWFETASPVLQQALRIFTQGYPTGKPIKEEEENDTSFKKPLE